MPDDLLELSYVPKSHCAAGQCSDCCKMIVLKGSKESYRFIVEHVAPGQIPEYEVQNAQHVVDHFIQIPIELAVQMNERRVAQNLYGNYFLCSWLDQATNLCRHHEDRPPLCRGFPFYDRDPMSPELFGGLAAYPQCSFWWDIPRDRWPAWVTEATVLPSPLPQNAC